MTTTHEAIRDLVKRLRHGAEGYGHNLSTLREAAAALEQLLEALEDAERVILPIAAAGLISEDMAADAERVGVGPLKDHSNFGLGIKYGDLRAAAAWQQKHGRTTR